MVIGNCVVVVANMGLRLAEQTPTSDVDKAKHSYDENPFRNSMPNASDVTCMIPGPSLLFVIIGVLGTIRIQDR